MGQTTTFNKGLVMLGFENECGSETLAGFSVLGDNGEIYEPVAEFENSDDALAAAMEEWEKEFGDGRE